MFKEVFIKYLLEKNVPERKAKNYYFKITRAVFRTFCNISGKGEVLKDKKIALSRVERIAFAYIRYRAYKKVYTLMGENYGAKKIVDDLREYLYKFFIIDIEVEI